MQYAPTDIINMVILSFCHSYFHKLTVLVYAMIQKSLLQLKWLTTSNVIQYGQNLLKCFEISWKNVLSYFLCKEEFPENKQFLANLPEIRKFSENTTSLNNTLRAACLHFPLVRTNDSFQFKTDLKGKNSQIKNASLKILTKHVN